MPVEELQELLSPGSTTQERLQGLVTIGLTHADLASATGVSESAVRNWTSGQAEPRHAGDIVIDDLRAAAATLLKGGVEPARAGRWLRSRNEDSLDNARPLDVVAHDPTSVLAAAHGEVLADEISNASENGRRHLRAIDGPNAS